MNKTVLVVDDNRLMLEFMGRVITDQGYKVTTAVDGFEALDHLTIMVPDIIFVDLIMPKIEGDTLCRIIRKMPHLDHSYIVVVSAAAAEMEMECSAFGANACIAKGAFNEMAKNIQKVIEEAALEDMSRPRPTGAVLGLNGILPRRMTKELLARNRHLAAILESISDGVLEVFSERVVYANAAAQYLLSSSIEKLTGTHLIKLFAPADQPKIARLLKTDDAPSALATEADTVSLGRRSVVVRKLSLHSDAEAAVVLLTDVTEKRNAEKELQEAYRQLEAKVAERTAALSTANEALQQEIAERKASEARLMESTERFDLFMRHFSAQTFIKDAQGRYIFINNAGQQFAGRPRDEIIGKTDRELWPADIAEQFIKNDHSVLEHNQALSTVEKARTPKGERYLLVSKFPIRSSDQSILLAGIALDITDQKKAEEERIRLSAQLQQAQKMEAIGRLAGGVAHDLNNILSGIVSYPELMLMDMPKDAPLRRPLEIVKNSGERAAAIVQDLLMLARGGIPEPEPIDIRKMIADYLDSPAHHELLKNHPKVTVTQNISQETLSIRGSVIMIRKSLQHLVSNAVASAAEINKGAVVITAENRALDRPLHGYDDVVAGDYVVIDISDNGPPLTTEQQDRIFEPFYTKKAMGRTDSGLGMAIVWGTARDHNGYVEVRSADARINRFSIYFPAGQRPAAGRRRGRSDDAIMGAGESILVVDDMEEQREIATGMLKKLGYQVTAVASGEKAVEHIKREPVDLVILDMIMDPGIDGVETLRQILESVPGQRVIIASGFSESHRIQEALRMGSGSYLNKPYLIDKLGRAVRTELDRQ
ncbi:MAG: response regulator [Pseudomonadota bacterium]